VKSGPRTSQERAIQAAIIPGARIPAPDDLEPAAKVLWDAIVIRLPEDWITTENVPLLKIYVRHTVYADRFAKDIVAQRELIATLEADDSRTKRHAVMLARANEKLIGLHRAHGFESDRMVAAATKLRLTQQSRYTHTKAASRSRATPASSPPWHDWGGSHPRTDS
jgi:hypothetical protein